MTRKYFTGIADYIAVTRKAKILYQLPLNIILQVYMLSI